MTLVASSAAVESVSSELSAETAKKADAGVAWSFPDTPTIDYNGRITFELVGTGVYRGFFTPASDGWLSWIITARQTCTFGIYTPQTVCLRSVGIVNAMDSILVPINKGQQITLETTEGITTNNIWFAPCRSAV